MKKYPLVGVKKKKVITWKNNNNKKNIYRVLYVDSGILWSLRTYPLQIRRGYCTVLNALYAITPWILTLPFDVVSINYPHFTSEEGLKYPAVWTNKLLHRDKGVSNRKYFIELESARVWRHHLTPVTGDRWRSLPGKWPSRQRLHTGSGISEHQVGKETFFVFTTLNVICRSGNSEENAYSCFREIYQEDMFSIV